MARKLASIQKIRNIRPIEGADRIELVTVNNWDVVSAKGNFQVGDLCVYFEIDSFLPETPNFEFLRKTSYRKMDDVGGFRLRTIKMRGQISQGLCVPLEEFRDELDPYNDIKLNTYSEGFDLTERLGVLKYEAPIPAQLEGIMKGGFPSFLQKTDEERIQNLTDKYEQYKKLDTKWYVTEKLDGSSSTYYLNDDEFGVCSRGIDLQRPEPFVEKDVVCEDGKVRKSIENSFWKVSREIGIEKVMNGYSNGQYGFFKNHAIQGELIGEGVQGNPYKIKGHSVRFFNLFDINSFQKANFELFQHWMEVAGFETVPVIDTDFTLPDTIEELLEYSDGKSVLNPDKWREGIVIRNHDNTISFKVISNKFLLKEK